MKLLSSLLLFTTLKLTYLPDVNLIFWLSIAMVIDLLTGVWKSKILNIQRTSTGFQRTVTKFLRYFGSIVVSISIQNMLGVKFINLPLGNFNIEVEQLTEYLIFYLFYIEILSIIENFIAMDKNDSFSKGPLTWLHNLLTLQFKNFTKKQK